MEPANPGRRLVLTGSGALAGAALLGGRPAAEQTPKATWTGRQFHNQPVESHLHPFLVDLWARVAVQTGGRLVVTVFAQNNQI
jgi:TRAP-type C4-dicarboxylate transport system substrate-binding protein